MDNAPMMLEDRAERAAFVSFRGWVGRMQIDGVGMDKIALALGAPRLALMDATREIWRRDSVVRMIWSVMGVRLECMRGSDILRWADDVATGEQVDCLAKIRAMKSAEGFEGRDAGVAFEAVERIAGAKEEALALFDLEAAYLERDAEGYARRLADCVRNAGDDVPGAGDVMPLEC